MLLISNNHKLCPGLVKVTLIVIFSSVVVHRHDWGIYFHITAVDFADRLCLQLERILVSLYTVFQDTHLYAHVGPQIFNGLPTG